MPNRLSHDSNHLRTQNMLESLGLFGFVRCELPLTRMFCWRAPLLLSLLLIRGASAQQLPLKAPTPVKTPAPMKTNYPSGVLLNGLYHNSFFGFTCKVPYGWVERTAEMQDDSSHEDLGETPRQTKDPQTLKPQVLLAVFERPPEATGQTVNSAVIIAAESVKSYPGLKAAVDYFVPLEEITKAKGFKVVNEPYEFPVGVRKLAREDFSKELGKLTMQQASLVILEKGYIVSFTFIGGGEDEVTELLAGLGFGSSSPPTRSPAPAVKK
jgi:hypothetical protein